ncbi:MAG: GGDEF domain-containing protein [Myxococcaceae bacterium]
MSDFAPYIDLLTGAFQRAHFEDLLAKAVSRCARDRKPLALLRIDVDDLQEHNDLHGRAALDQALSWLASKVSLALDGKGPIGRIDGDEFAVFLEGVPLSKAVELAEALRRLIPRTLHSSGFGDYRLTVSAGVAALKPGEPWGNLFDAAEAAMTRAKQGGRDLVASR